MNTAVHLKLTTTKMESNVFAQEKKISTINILLQQNFFTEINTASTGK